MLEKIIINNKYLLNIVRTSTFRIETSKLKVKTYFIGN